MENKKSEIMSIIKGFREFIKTFGFKYKKSIIENLRKSLRSHEKIVNDEDEDDIEYLQEKINYLNNLFKGYIKKQAL